MMSEILASGGEWRHLQDNAMQQPVCWQAVRLGA
jgi:hypothetical protein